MNSLLQHWGRRVLGQTHQVAPRVPTRFEPTPADGVGDGAAIEQVHSDEVVAASEQNPPTRTPEGARPQPPSALEAEKNATVPNEPSPTLSSSEAMTKDGQGPPSSTTPSPIQQPTATQSDGAGSNKPESIPVSETKILEKTELQKSLVHPDPIAPERGDDRGPSTSRLADELARLREWMEETEPEAATVSQDDESAAQVERTGTTEEPKAPSRSIADVPVSDGLTATPPVKHEPPKQSPRVQVNIGTVIVRASQPSSSQNLPRPHPREQRIANLAAYLARRTS